MNEASAGRAKKGTKRGMWLPDEGSEKRPIPLDSSDDDEAPGSSKQAPGSSKYRVVGNASCVMKSPFC